MEISSKMSITFFLQKASMCIWNNRVLGSFIGIAYMHLGHLSFLLVFKGGQMQNLRQSDRCYSWRKWLSRMSSYKRMFWRYYSTRIERFICFWRQSKVSCVDWTTSVPWDRGVFQHLVDAKSGSCSAIFTSAIKTSMYQPIYAVENFAQWDNF